MIEAFKITFDSEYFRYYENVEDAEKFAKENGYIIVSVEPCTVKEEWVY